MKTVINLETKDVRIIIAKYLGISIEDVTPNRYSFSVANITAEKVAERIRNDDNK